MPLLFRYLAWVVGVVAGLLTASVASRADGNFTWGVNGHPLESYFGVTIESQLDAIKRLGVKSYRVDISRVEQIPALKRLVVEARKQGTDILPVITPAQDIKKGTAKEHYDAAYKLAVAVITPLKDLVRVWELGNEMENLAIITACEMRDNGVQYNCEWGPAGGVDPLDYYGPRWIKVSAILRGLSDGAKAVDPGIRRAMGTAGWGHTGAFERMHADGIEWDISVWHMYGQDPEWALKFLQRYGRPIWITEFNHPGGSADGEEIQARELVRTMKRISELAPHYRVEAAHIYELLDEPYWEPSFEARMGLMYLEKAGEKSWKIKSPKHAFDAVRRHLLEAHEELPLTRVSARVGADTVSAVRRQCNLDAGEPSAATVTSKVTYAYCLVLGRVPDGAGLQFWEATLKRSVSAADMVAGMVESDEFKLINRVSSISTEDYVSLMYKILLVREPDTAGLQSYVAAIDAGQLNRKSLAQVLTRSAEFGTRHPILAAH